MMYPSPEQCELIVDCVAGITLMQGAFLAAFCAWVLWSATHHG